MLYRCSSILYYFLKLKFAQETRSNLKITPFEKIRSRNTFESQNYSFRENSLKKPVRISKLLLSRKFAQETRSNLKITPFEKIRSRNPFIRKARESYLIDKHQLISKGLNKKL